MSKVCLSAVEFIHSSFFSTIHVNLLWERKNPQFMSKILPHFKLGIKTSVNGFPNTWWQNESGIESKYPPAHILNKVIQAVELKTNWRQYTKWVNGFFIGWINLRWDRRLNQQAEFSQGHPLPSSVSPHSSSYSSHNWATSMKCDASWCKEASWYSTLSRFHSIKT